MSSIGRIFVARQLKGSSPLKLPKKLFSNQAKADDRVIDWKTFKVAAVSVFGTLVTVLSIYTATKEFMKGANELLPESIPPALEKARVTTSHAKANYVSRPNVKAQINDFLDSDSIGYCVIYGAKGVGKSEVVDHTAIGRRAVVKVPVTTVGTQEDLVALIMETLTGKRTLS